MKTMEKYQEVIMDRQNEVETRLMQENEEYQELNELIIRVEGVLRKKGEGIAELLRRREEAEMALNNIVGQALYKAGLADGLTMLKDY